MDFFFTGKYDLLLDDKNRLAIPSKWRDQFDAPAYLTSGEEACIAVYTKGAFEQAAAEVQALPKSSEAGRIGRRKFFGDARDVMKDGSGRLLIPQSLIDHANLKRDITVVGAGEWFEIWDAAAWNAYMSSEEGR